MAMLNNQRVVPLMVLSESTVAHSDHLRSHPVFLRKKKTYHDVGDIMRGFTPPNLRQTNINTKKITTSHHNMSWHIYIIQQNKKSTIHTQLYH